LLSELGKQKSGKVLDVGCGTGDITLEIKKLGHEVGGVDFSEVATTKAREKGIDARTSDVDKHGLDFASESFDYVWMTDVVEHVFDPINLLSETNRVLKPGGQVYLTVPNDFPLARRLFIFLRGESVQSGIYRHLGICKHHTMFSQDLIDYMLKRAGLEEIFFSSILTLPRTKFNQLSSSRRLGKWLGRVFIIRAAKKDDK
jgi:ubiquinone/menaquinone biosynthesis C-methylase UbiE